MNKLLYILLYITVQLSIIISCRFSDVESGDGGNGNNESKSKGGVSFKPHADTKYGLDIKSTEIESYISLKKGNDSTKFIASLSNIPKGSAATSDTTVAIVTEGVSLVSGNNPVKICSGLLPKFCQINIFGCSNEENTGDCYIEKNHMNVLVYNEKTVPLNIVRLNANAFDWDTIGQTFDTILKQAVFKVEPIRKISSLNFNKSLYDKNGNGRIDIWFSNPPTACEWDDLKTAAMDSSWWETGNPAIVIVQENIRLHINLVSTFLVGSKAINVEYGDGNAVYPGAYIYFGPVDSSSTGLEKMWVKTMSAGWIHVQRDSNDTGGTRYEHPAATHSIWSDNLIIGKTSRFENFAVLGENADQRTAVHEFLHMDISGALRHVVDDDNIMYNKNADGLLLRYRPIRRVEISGNEDQWTLIQR